MANLFDYLEWRGDIPLSQVPFNAADNLVLSTLVYVHFEDIIAEGHEKPITVGEACRTFCAMTKEQQRARVRSPLDMRLAEEIQNAPRFAELQLVFHREEFDAQTEIQFAALGVLLGDGSAYVSFRGTDNTLIGWKEDFNMTFQEVISGHRAAQAYLAEFCAGFEGDLLLGGHSKGGNLAVYAAASAPKNVRDRIKVVYNNDGPGFFRTFLDSEGYQDICKRIQLVTPQSSIVGLFLEHDEPYTAIHSSELGPFQHDPYSWSIMRGDFIRLDDVSAGSHIVDRTLKRFIGGMTNEERAEFVDTAFQILSVGDLRKVDEFKDPRNVYGALKSLALESADKRAMLLRNMANLARSAGSVILDGEETPKKKRRFKVTKLREHGYFRRKRTD